MLAQRISSINSLSALCEKTGADINQLSKAIGSDHRIGPHFLKASVGFGGSCFQKDILNLVYLCRHFGLEEVAEYWHQVVKINDYQKERFSQKIIDDFNGDLSHINVTVLGWAFKANTNDTRESPAIYITRDLFNSGAIIEIYDPMVSRNKIIEDIGSYWGLDQSEFNHRLNILTEIDYKNIETDLVLVLTEWDEFKELKNLISDQIKIYDGRYFINN